MNHPARRPPSLILAAALLLVEAVVACVFGVLAIGQVEASGAVVGVGVGVFFLIYGLALLAVGRGVLRGRRWSRAPAVATQILLLPIAWGLRVAPTTGVATVVALVAVAVLVGLLHPRSTRVFVGSGDLGPGHQD